MKTEAVVVMVSPKLQPFFILLLWDNCGSPIPQEKEEEESGRVKVLSPLLSLSLSLFLSSLPFQFTFSYSFSLSPCNLPFQSHLLSPALIFACCFSPFPLSDQPSPLVLCCPCQKPREIHSSHCSYETSFFPSLSPREKGKRSMEK